MSETSIPLSYIIHSFEINPALISDSLDVFQSLVNASLHISAWNAGQKPHWKKKEAFSWGASFWSSVLHASLLPQSMWATAAALPALSSMFTISLVILKLRQTLIWGKKWWQNENKCSLIWYVWPVIPLEGVCHPCYNNIEYYRKSQLYFRLKTLHLHKGGRYLFRIRYSFLII